MHSRLLKCLMLLIPAVTAFSASANAQHGTGAYLNPVYKRWVNEDVYWIITPKERREFVNLVTDDQCLKFVADFWERRNPTPGSKENEFKREHYRRLAFSNEHFAAGIPGSRTDRGRIYVVYGSPDSIRVPSKPGDSPEEDWFYGHIDGAGDDVILKFVDDCFCGAYELKQAPAAMY